jgi:hypothetical protein
MSIPSGKGRKADSSIGILLLKAQTHPWQFFQEYITTHQANGMHQM